MKVPPSALKLEIQSGDILVQGSDILPCWTHWTNCQRLTIVYKAPTPHVMEAMLSTSSRDSWI